jgi:hypothetical protein
MFVSISLLLDWKYQEPSDKSHCECGLVLVEVSKIRMLYRTNDSNCCGISAGVLYMT